MTAGSRYLRAAGGSARGARREIDRKIEQTSVRGGDEARDVARFVIPRETRDLKTVVTRR
jgi:hypothetical protein